MAQVLRDCRAALEEGWRWLWPLVMVVVTRGGNISIRNQGFYSEMSFNIEGNVKRNVVFPPSKRVRERILIRGRHFF